MKERCLLNHPEACHLADPIVDRPAVRSSIRFAILGLCFVGFLDALPADATPDDFAIAKGRRVTRSFSIQNTCPKPTTWKVEIKKLKLARARQKKFTVPPGGIVKAKIDFDASREKKSKTYSGTIAFKCSNCKKCSVASGEVRKDYRVAVIDVDPFLDSAKEFAVEADLPVRPMSLAFEKRITQATIHETAIQLLRSSVFFHAQAEVMPVMEHAAVLADVDLSALAEQMIAQDLVQPGQYLAKMTWQRANGDVAKIPTRNKLPTLANSSSFWQQQPVQMASLNLASVWPDEHNSYRVKPKQVSFSDSVTVAPTADFQDELTTLAAISEDGSGSWEPILFFNSTHRIEAPKPARERGSQKSGPWRMMFQNGLGSTCVKVEWTVAIATKGCKITDPSDPPIHLDYDKNCWTWTVDPFPRERSSDPGECKSDDASQEDCISWFVGIRVFNGFGPLVKGDKIHIPKAFRKGKPPISERPFFGNDAWKDDMGKLCAESGEAPRLRGRQ